MKTRKVLAMLLVLVFVFALTAGCGNNDANNAGTPAGDGQGTGEDDNQQAEGDTITIGVNFELSGDLASYGQSKINGVKIALEEINENGGILGLSGAGRS